MTQTATFPNLESLPNVSTQALLYFSLPMGTLTEVDVVTSGSFQTEFHAENLGPSNSTITGTTTGSVSINTPTGTLVVTIPTVTETFNASAYDRTLDYGGTSGKDFAPVTSSSAAQTTVLTSPADLAAFTGHFRIPIGVAGGASGTATSSDGNISAGFDTQTAATITVIYHFVPNLASLDGPSDPASSSQPPSVSGSANGAGSSGSPASLSTSPSNGVAPVSTGTTSLVQPLSTQSHQSASHAGKTGAVRFAASFHKSAHHAFRVRVRPKAGGHSGDWAAGGMSA
jgi:hypothetical protein